MFNLRDYTQVYGKLCLICIIILSQWQNLVYFHGYANAEIQILPTKNQEQNDIQDCVYDDEDETVISVFVNGESCSLEVATAVTSLLIIEVIEEYINGTDYLYVENEEASSNTCSRFLTIDGYLRRCKVAFTSSKIRLHIRGSMVLRLRDEPRYATPEPYTLCPEQAGSHSGSENATDGTLYGIASECGYARGYAVKVSCAMPLSTPSHNQTDAASSGSLSRCDLQCSIDCTCILSHRQVRYCPNSNNVKSDTSGLFVIPDEISYLNMSNSYLVDIERGAFQGMRRLRQLNLSRNMLTIIKEGAFKGMDDLNGLDLSYNLLVNIHRNAFSGLDNLNVLWVDHNLLTNLHHETFRGLINLRGLVMSFNKLTYLDPMLLQYIRSLEILSMFNNSLTKIESETFISTRNLKYITLSSNMIDTISPRAFSGLEIQALYLSTNRLESLDKEAFGGIKSITILDLQENGLRNFPQECIQNLRTLDALNASNNHLHIVPELGALKKLSIIDLRHNELSWIHKGTFYGLPNNTMVLVNEPVTCCFIQDSQCLPSAPTPPYITCGRLLPNKVLDVFMWVLGWSALLGNVFVLVWRRQGKFEENQIQVLLITNLAASDLLMGIYMLIISSADIHFGKFFPAQAEYWRSSRVCKFAGTLAVSSSEASVFFVTLISIDRYTRIAFPYTAHQLRYHSARAISIVLWIIAIGIGIVPSIMSYIKPTLYDVSEVCIGLPLVRKQILELEELSYATGDILLGNNRTRKVLTETGTTSNTYFSITVFLGVNLLCCLIVLFCYAEIFWTVKRTGFTTNRRGRDREIRMAMKMSLIVLTDFVCWMPIIIMGILVQSGATEVSPTVFAWIVTLILPINSSVNPILYTLATAISSWSRQKNSKENTHPEMQPMNTRGGGFDMSTVMTRTRANTVDMNGAADE